MQPSRFKGHPSYHVVGQPMHPQFQIHPLRSRTTQVVHSTLGGIRTEDTLNTEFSALSDNDKVTEPSISQENLLA